MTDENSLDKTLIIRESDWEHITTKLSEMTTYMSVLHESIFDISKSLDVLSQYLGAMSSIVIDNMKKSGMTESEIQEEINSKYSKFMTGNVELPQFEFLKNKVNETREFMEMVESISNSYSLNYLPKA